MLWLPLVAAGLDAASALQGPVAVLHGADVPALCAVVPLQLERFMVGDLVLICGHVNA